MGLGRRLRNASALHQNGEGQRNWSAAVAAKKRESKILRIHYGILPEGELNEMARM
jgi:hypothetical protein